jgi:RNA polymerase sigma factor (sigma-70 family)
MARVLCNGIFDEEDIAQEVFCIASARLASYDPRRASPSSWLYGITANVVRRLRRRQAMRIAFAADESASLHSSPRAPIDLGDLLEAARVAEKILASMAPKKREALILAEFESLECAAIAAIVGAKEETVWSRLYYARREFNRRLGAWRRRQPSDPSRPADRA